MSRWVWSHSSYGGMFQRRRPRGAAPSGSPCRSARTRRRSAPAAHAARRPSARGRLGIVDSLRGERRPRPLEGAVDRRDATCRGAPPPPRPAIAGPRAGSARPAAWAAGAGARRRTPAGPCPAGTVRSAGSPPAGRIRPSGIGSIQAVSGSGAPSGASALARRIEVHRPRPTLAAPEHVEADVRGDPVQPRPERPTGPRSGRSRATPGPGSPGRRPRPRRRSRASGSSTPVSSTRYCSSRSLSDSEASAMEPVMAGPAAGFRTTRRDGSVMRPPMIPSRGGCASRSARRRTLPRQRRPAGTSGARRDVLVEPEEVGRVVAPLDVGQPVPRRARVGGAHAGPAVGRRKLT